MRTTKNSSLPWLKEIPQSWCMTKVKYIAEVVPGATPKSSVQEYWNGDIPFVTSADYTTADHYVEHGGKTITEEGMESCSTSLLPAGSLIVSTRAPIGLAAINSIPVCTNQGCKGLIQRGENYSFEYLYRLLSIADGALNALGNGTTYQELSGRALSNFLLPCPPLQEQNAIVAYLDTRCTPIDEAIARHRAAIGKLEEYRRAVITKAVTKGLDPNADMKDSGIGWIGKMPSSWRLEKLKYLCESRNGLDYKAQDVCDISDPDSVFVVRSSNIINGCIKHGDDVYINKQIPNALQLHRGDLIIVRTNGSQRLVGKCAMLDTDEKCTAGAFMLICRSIFNPYIYWVLRSELLSFHRGQFDTTTINQLSNDMLRNMLIPLPPSEQMLSIMAYLDYQCSAVDDAIDRQNQIIAKLEEYRRSLIHAAVTGRIDCTEEIAS